ncbi:MAG TPA: SAM-dependent methyltransferase [Gammaproteobacteria bacterium]|nr:SAM-dependent methyltransferase [Gammaproteobacteria bacterium]
MATDPRANPGGAVPPGLPAPDAEAAAHSQRLRAAISDAIAAAGGAITFQRFMELALHAPGLGYYSAGSRKLGGAGDFVTAPELSPLFARTLAGPCRTALGAVGAGANVLEVGAGSGALAAGLLAELAAADALPEEYRILEISAELRERQRQTLQACDPALAARVRWVDDLPPSDFHGVVLANELLDAMPVHRFVVTENGLRESYVAIDEAGEGFVWQTGEPSTSALVERVEAIEAAIGGPLPIGYTSEINLAAEDWVRALGPRLEAALVLLIDYGFGRGEYYHPQRHMGTLMCHYRHHAHGDPLVLVGLQDITAHVDFTAIAEAADGAGLTVAGYTTQAHFLLGSGLAQLAQAAGGDDPAEQLRVANEVKRLTLPHEMGELFKVMGLTRGIDLQLPGFALNDMRQRL